MHKKAHIHWMCAYGICMEKIKIGQVVNVVGLKGELKVYHYSDYKERFDEIDSLYLDETEYKIERVRYQGNMVILKLPGINDRDQAELQRGKAVFITENQLRPLPEGVYYIRDILGFDVISHESEYLGKLTDVIQNSAQDLYEVELENGKKLLIPAVKAFVLETNIDGRFIKVKLLEGLLDL